jgi:hypothetical protein
MSNGLTKFYDNGTWWTLTLNVTSGLALIGAAAWFSFTVFAAKEAAVPPRVVESIVLEPTILTAGQPFIAHIKVHLYKLCPYEVHWSLVRKSDHVEAVKIIDPIRQPPAQLGEQELAPIKRYIPQTVSPGDYTYVSEVFDICPGTTYTSVRRNVDITIR